MTRMRFIIPAALLTGTLVTAGGVLAYDDARPTQLAAGITVAGIPVGGLEPAAAQAKLDRELVAALERPVVVHHGKRRWTLGAREAQLRTNVDRVIADAQVKSEEGGVLGRTARRLTGGELALSLQPEITFSDRAVVRLVDRVRRAVGRRAEDATLTLSAAGPALKRGRRGLAVEASELHRRIDAALVLPGADRSLAARTRKLRPKVSTKELKKRHRVVLIADRGGNTLRLYRNLELVKSYGIAAGSAAYPTPAGQFTIANKAVNPAWSVPDSDWAGSLQGKVIPGGAPENPLKARWMGIIDGVGIHGTSAEGSIGTNASHGCLRMRVADVVELFPNVPVGARILIV